MCWKGCKGVNGCVFAFDRQGTGVWKQGVLVGDIRGSVDRVY